MNKWLLGCGAIGVCACVGSAAVLGIASRAVGALQGASVACDGTPVPGAAIYAPGSSFATTSFERTERAGWQYFGGLVPHTVPHADSAESAAVVFCFEAEVRALTETCHYDGGVRVERYTRSRHVRLVEASTARILREADVAGAIEACPDSVATTTGGGPAVSVRVLGIPVATVGGVEALPAERIVEGAGPDRTAIETTFGDLLR